MTGLRALLGSSLRTVRKSILAASSATGITRRLLDSPWRQQRLAILCYHGISTLDEHEWRSSLYLTQERLISRFRALKAMGCVVLPLGEALDLLREGRLPPRAVALTFDDGAHDFLSRALPVLEEFAFPSTVYVATWYAERPTWPVFTVGLSYLLWRSRQTPVLKADFVALCGAGTDQLRTSFEELTRRLVLRAQAEQWSGADKQQFLERLAPIVGFDLDGMIARRQLCLMSLEELSALPASVSLQLHTHTHITPDNENSLREQIERNREKLMATARPHSDPLVHFCYPSGIVQEGQPGWLAACGIRSATTCDVRLASREDDPLLLPRIIDTTTMSGVEFANWIAGSRQFLKV